MQSLSEQFLAHQIYLQRYASQEAYKVQPFIRRMIKIIKDEVLKQEGTRLSNAKLRALLKDLNEQLYVVTGEWDAEIIRDLEKFAAYETNWASKAISTPLPDGVNFVVPAPEQVWAAVQFAPLELNDKPVDFSKLMGSWAPSEVERLTMGVKTGFVRGQTTKEIVRQVVGAGGLADISRRNAEAIVRTAVNHVSTQAKQQVYARNSDIITGYEWVSTLDSSTTPICRDRDGEVYGIGKGPLPPAHYNCLSGDTVVSTCSPVSNVYKRPYKGVMINIVTKSGRTMTITPNHPVLTSSGWVAAGDLDLGSKLACCDDIALIIENQKDCVIAEFGKLFSALDVLSDPHLVSNAPTTTKDFHGDVTDGEVNVISVNSESWGKVKAAFSEEVVYGGFPLRSFVDLPLPSYSGGMDVLIGSCFPSNGIMGSLCQGGYLFWGASSHPGALLLASIPEPTELIFKGFNNWGWATPKVEVGVYTISSNPIEIGSVNIFELGVCESYGLSERNGYSVGLKYSLDWLFTAAEQLPNLVASNLVYGVELDDVVDIGIIEFDGHVYNLENENNWYLSNGIITHNCRSTTSPTVSSEFDFLDQGGKRAARGADGGTQVNADVSYYDWLKSQPAAFQDDVLGKTKGAIFRNAGLTADEFRAATVDRYGNPLTIEQMAEKDELIAQYLAKS